MINIYGKHGCARCESVKSLLDKRGIIYSYQLIEEMKYQDHIKDLITIDNQGMYPLIMNDDKVVSLKDVLNKV
jgi:arsenate reductase-like glutaredoxin family protein